MIFNFKTIFLFALFCIIGGKIFSQSKIGVSFVPQLTKIHTKSKRGQIKYGYSLGLNAQIELNNKMDLGIDLFYSKQKGDGICDIPLRYDTTAPSISRGCIISHYEVYSLLKLPIYLNYKLNDWKKMSSGILLGLQPFLLLKNQSELDGTSSNYRSVYFALVSGYGVEYRVSDKILLNSQLRIEYNHDPETIFSGYSQQGISGGVILGILCGVCFQS